ncbi:sensor histidine kinase [Streptomyces xiangluensis]|uniref:histidine kinase n=1 Tax=Streptomyces xiangluensis TaxID=2665720 RepID=A0ABV8YHB1_9ACTN
MAALCHREQRAECRGTSGEERPPTPCGTARHLCRWRSTATVVRVREHGPGFPPDLLAVLHTTGPQRFRTGSRTGGTGLGLTIATGQARLLGARLTFRNGPEGGAETELELPTA